MNWFKRFLKDFDFRKSLKKQLKLSIIVIAVYSLYYFAVFDKNKGRVGILGFGSSYEQQEADKQNEIPWEVLLVDPSLRAELWKTYESVDEKEQNRALEILVLVLPKLGEKQAEHLTDGVIERTGATRSSKQLVKLLLALGELGSQFKITLSSISAYVMKSLRWQGQNEQKLYKLMMKKIERRIGENPAKYCLKEGVRVFADCANSLATDGSTKSRDEVWSFFKKHSTTVEAEEALLVLARTRDPRPKGELDRLLHSARATDVQLALRLIRIFGSGEYLDELARLQRSTQNPVLESDFQMTIQYLSMASVTATKGQRAPASR